MDAPRLKKTEPGFGMEIEGKDQKVEPFAPLIEENPVLRNAGELTVASEIGAAVKPGRAAKMKKKSAKKAKR